MLKRSYVLYLVITIICLLSLSAILLININDQLTKEQEAYQYMQSYYDYKVQQFQEENRKYNKSDIVFLGDSLTDGYNWASYYQDYVVLNRGISGDTTFGLYDRLLVSAYSVNPKVVVLLIGTNNLTTMFDNFEDLLKDLKNHLPNSSILVMSIPPRGATFKDTNELVINNNIKLQRLTLAYNYIYVDIFSRLYDETNNIMDKAYTTDDLHFSLLGYEIITNELDKYLIPLLKDNK